MNKVLGIIGGMGPLATVKLFENIVLLTEADCDQDHIHILIDNNTSIPDRTNYILKNSDEDPKVELIQSALKLESMGADYLVMPCNTAHSFYDEICENISIPFLNMIQETANYIVGNYKEAKKIGLLSTEGTIKSEVYDKIFNEQGIELVKPSKEKQKHITEMIYNIKEGNFQDDLHGFNSTIDELKEQGVEIFIAGCTEISLAIDIYDLKDKLMDPMKIIASKAIEFAGKKAKDI